MQKTSDWYANQQTLRQQGLIPRTNSGSGGWSIGGHFPTFIYPLSRFIFIFQWKFAEDTDQDPNQQFAVTDRHEIREDVEGNVFVKDLRVIPVTTESGEYWYTACVSLALLREICFLICTCFPITNKHTNHTEVITVVQMGLKLRATHETRMNATSSRSHTVFTITIVQKDRSTGEETTGMLNLVS